MGYRGFRLGGGVEGNIGRGGRGDKKGYRLREYEDWVGVSVYRGRFETKGRKGRRVKRLRDIDWGGGFRYTFWK